MTLMESIEYTNNGCLLTHTTGRRLCYALIFSTLLSSFIFLVVLTVYVYAEDKTGCLDHNGNLVDAFIIYKLPKSSKSSLKHVREGVAYMFMTLGNDGSNDAVLNWTLSEVGIDDPSSMPGQTLAPLYNGDAVETTITMMYNDEVPDGPKSESHGHTKGVVAISKNNGYWLIHSVPNYPPHLSKKEYSYPGTGHTYGQTMMCVSFNNSQADEIGYQLLENYPQLYEAIVPKKFKKYYPIFNKVASGAKPTGCNERISNLQSRANRKFISFAKFTKYNEDLYENLVAPHLKTNLLVETWRNGENPLSSSCNGTYQVENIESISFKSLSDEFSTHKDHSKWAIGSSSTLPFVCIGDINRMKSQFHRAGGTVCLESSSVWNSFNQLVSKVDSCPK